MQTKTRSSGGQKTTRLAPDLFPGKIDESQLAVFAGQIRPVGGFGRPFCRKLRGPDPQAAPIGIDESTWIGMRNGANEPISLH